MKQGIHANSLRQADKILAYYRRTQAASFKTLVFDEAFFRELRGIVPHVKIAGRVYEDNQQLGAEGGRYNRRIVEHARAYPSVDYWEGPNEAFQWQPDIGRYSNLEVERVTMLAGLTPPRRAIVGNFSTGNPDITTPDHAQHWRDFAPAIRAAMAYGGLLGKHEYDAPYFDRLIEGDIWQPSARGWLALRYRKDVAILAALGVTNIKWALTETGLDGGVNPRPGPQGGGWYDFRDYPSPKLGAYDKQRRWYDWQLSSDPNVLFVVGFGESSEDPTWDSFSIFRDDAMTDAIIAAEADLPIWHFAPPVVTPPVVRPPVTPPNPPPPPVRPPMQASYTVVRGDTLSKLGQRFGIPWPEIAAANNLRPPYVLSIGMVLVIPGIASVPSVPLYAVADGPYTAHRWPRPNGQLVSWIIVHSPAAAAGATPQNVKEYLRRNDRQVSYGEYIEAGKVTILAGPDYWTGHSGSDSARIPNTEVRGRFVNYRTVGVALHDAPTVERAVMETGARRVADLIRQFGLPDAGVVLGHLETDPTRRHDPIGVNMTAFRSLVHGFLT